MKRKTVSSTEPQVSSLDRRSLLQHITVGHVSFIQKPDGIVLVHVSRPSLEVSIEAGELERWAMRKLKEGVFT